MQRLQTPTTEERDNPQQHDIDFFDVLLHATGPACGFRAHGQGDDLPPGQHVEIGTVVSTEMHGRFPDCGPDA